MSYLQLVNIEKISDLEGYWKISLISKRVCQLNLVSNVLSVILKAQN